MQGVLGDLLLPPQSMVTHQMCPTLPHLFFLWGLGASGASCACDGEQGRKQWGILSSAGVNRAKG